MIDTPAATLLNKLCSNSRWNKALSCLSALLLWTAVTTVSAAPFKDLTIEFRQPDGTLVRVIGSGDEFYAEFETPDGFSTVFDPALGAYCFAQPTSDGRLASTGRQIHVADPVALGLKKHLRMGKAARREQIVARWQRWEAAMQIEKRWNQWKAALREYESQRKDGPQPGPPPNTTTGLKVGLTLLIDFDDDPATVPQAEIVDFCNGDAYTGYGNNGSVKKYYLDNSNELLTYSNVVTIYVRIPNSLHPKSWYNDTSKDCGDQGNLLVRDAIQVMKALPNYATEILPSFANLTVDGNNRVVACNVFYAGGNGGVWNYGLWPNSWALVNVGAQELSPGGKKVWDYQITNIGSSLQLGTFCHENGHMLCGFPDLYDYDAGAEASSGGAGKFCLMNSGSHGGNPAQICAYLKRAAGWATTTELNNSSTLTATLSALAGTEFNHFYRYQKPSVPTEYFLLECRYASGRDATLPASGIAIWHIDELGDHNNQSLVPNATHQNYEVTLVQADNQWHFESNSNSGDSYDLYYAGNTAAAYSNQFTDASQPNAHWWDGSASGAAFHDFTAKSSRMNFLVGYTDMPPSIVAQPQNQTVLEFHAASFSVGALGTPPLAYQWFFNGMPIQGATANIFNIPSAAIPDHGDYFVTISNALGAAASQTVSLTVLPGISLAQALDTTNLAWISGGDVAWEGQYAVSHDNADAAASGAIRDSQESWLQTTITNGPGTLSFWWKVDSETGYDILHLEVDGVEIDSISGQFGWSLKACTIPAGTHDVRWRYSKDVSVSSGADRGWVDEVAFTPGLIITPPTLAEALDGPDLQWTTSDTNGWFGETTITHDAVDAAQSGPITHNAQSWIQTTVFGPGTLSFWWKVSSELNYDFLSFDLDGQEQDGSISGEGNWSQRTFRIPVGTHSLRWVYSKDVSLSSGLDRGWLDQISYRPDAILPPVLVNATNLLDGSFQFSVEGSPASCIVQVSTNLTAWTPLATNTPPFTFTDPQAPVFRQRFYRVQSAF